MKKFIGILSILVIIGCLGYLGYQKVTDFMVRKTLTLISEDESIQQHLDAVMEEIELTTEDPQKAPSEAETDTPPYQTSEKGKTADAPKGDTKEIRIPTQKEPTPAKIPEKDEKRQPIVFPKAPEKTPTPSAGGLTIDSLESADKAYVMNIYKRFTASEVTTVSGMLSGGITAEEKKQIKAIVYAKVSSAEVNELYRIANKYR